MPWQGELLKRVEALERRASLKRWTTRSSQHDYVESGLARHDPYPFVANTTATREQLVAAFPWLLGGQERHRNDRHYGIAGDSAGSQANPLLEL